VSLGPQDRHPGHGGGEQAARGEVPPSAEGRAPGAPSHRRPRNWLLVSGALLVVVLLVVGVTVWATSSDDRDGEWRAYDAAAADSFLDTVGVAMHAHYGDTAYGENDLQALLEQLGVRHIRDALTPESMPFYVEFVERAGPGAGVSYILNDGEQLPLEEQIRMVAEVAPGTASQIESDNEPDCDDWSEAEAERYREQARVMRATMDRYGLADVPLATPSFCRTVEDRYLSYGDDGVSERFNFHPYFAGKLPEEEIGDILSWISEADPDAVPVATEAGYHNAVETDDDHKPTSEIAESAYLPQMLLEFNRRGVALTHTYELLDLRDNPERDYDQENFGLFHADGTIKPSGASMAALLDTLRDTDGERPEAGSVDIAVSGGGDDIRLQPFLRSDGSIDIALWMAQPIWDEDERVDLPNPSTDVVVQVRDSGQGSYVRIDGTEDPERVDLPSGRSFTVPVNANPTILRVGG
jgi:hypothetical protein